MTSSVTPVPPRARALLVTAFAAYLAVLVWAIVWKLDVPSIGAAALLPRPIKLVPFIAWGDAGSSASWEVLANVLLFVPFGVYGALLAPRWRWGRVALAAAGTSLALETVQHLLATGSFDSTDVIANTAGALAGLGILFVARHAVGVHADRPATHLVVVATALGVVAAAVFAASPLHVAQLPDVVAGIS